MIFLLSINTGFWKNTYIFKFVAFNINISLIGAKKSGKDVRANLLKSLTWHFVNMMEDKVHGGGKIGHEYLRWSEVIKTLMNPSLCSPACEGELGSRIECCLAPTTPLLLKTKVVTLSTVGIHVFPCLIRIRYSGCDVQDYPRENEISVPLTLHFLNSLHPHI